jgi:hypothetical protein
VRVLAAKTEFKTIASKTIQHPAVTIERIKRRRRVIELSVQTRLGGAAASNHAAATPNRAVRMAEGSHQQNRTTARTIEFCIGAATKLAR